MQAQLDAVAKGKSAVVGVSYHKGIRRWIIQTRRRWVNKSHHLATAGSREEAEAIVGAYFPRLEAAAAEGRFVDELETVKAELKL